MRPLTVYIYMDGLNSTLSRTKFNTSTAIKVLFIREFDGMKTLPEWLGNISSLEWLQLYRCKNLEYLPTKQAIQHVIQLEINDCPKLKERCAKGSGAEWSKISDIARLYIDGEYIKK